MRGEALKIRVFHMQEVRAGKNFRLENERLSVPTEFAYDFPDIEQLSIRILPPRCRDVQTNTIMDVIPISTKVLGTIGRGITHTLTGVCVVLCGAIRDGEQMHEFGSSEGILNETMKWNQAGTPKYDDYVILLDMLAKKGCNLTRTLCLDMFALADLYIQQIRNQLKTLNGKDAVETYVYKEESHPGKLRIALVKQVAGQGAMYDTSCFPKEPSGFEGGISIIDINNMPVLLTPNEYRDGALRAMV